MNELLTDMNWTAWLPISIAVMSLGLSFFQMRKKTKVTAIAALEKNIDRAHEALKESQELLKQCGHEKNEMRHERLVLLEQIAKLQREAD